jgi:hypothetical protein
MRVVPLDRKINPRYRFLFFYFSLLNIFGRQSSEQLHKIQPPACSVCMCSNLSWLAHFGEKICQNTDLFFFGLQEMEFLTHEELYSKELFIPLPHFWSTIPQRKKCKHMQKPWSEHAKNHDPNMQKVVCYEAARNFVYQIYSRVINKNEKPIARVDFPIQRHHSHADPILPDCTFMWSVR